MNNDNFIHTLLTDIPEFEPSYQEHLEDNEGELLTHVLFGELFDFTVEHVDKPDVLKRIIGFINKAAASSDEDLVEAVHVSFLEYVPESPADDAIKALLDETTLAMYETIVNWRPDESIKISH